MDDQMVSAWGIAQTKSAWARDPRCLVTRKALRDRLARGMAPEEAMTTPPAAVGSPVGRKGRLLEAYGETKTLPQWAADPRCMVTRTALRQRLAKGWALEAALSAEPARQSDHRLRSAYGEPGLKTLADLVRDPRCAATYETAVARLARGMSLDEALTATFTVLRSLQVTEYAALDDRKSLTGWIADERCPVAHPSTLHARIHKLGMPLEEAITHPPFERTSLAEEALLAYVASLGVEVEPHAQIDGREVDIYLPGHHLGIEYNGVFWHSERYQDQLSHFRKWQVCAGWGIRLLQIWEDDYLARPAVVRSLIRHKLGLGGRRLFARTLRVEELSRRDARDFLDAHHIQGPAPATVQVGLRTGEGELVAVCSFKRQGDGAWDLVRYATSAVVVGGFTKCLAHFTRNHPWSAIVTFADHCISDGGLYRLAGFTAEGEVPPDYRYVVDGRREHKFGYRLARFRSDPGLRFEEGLTERELAALNGLPRIWDAGKTRWVLRPTS